jgi:hypothetical protein
VWRVEDILESAVTMERPRFFNQSTFIVCGSSRCGKTVWVSKLLYNLDEMFQKGAPGKILYCYRTAQDVLLQMERDIPGFILYKGLPTQKEIEELSSPQVELLIVLDDLIHDVIQSKDMSDLFMTGRHLNLSIIFITQNCFEQGKYGRGIQINACYFVLFKNLRDRGQVKRLAGQIFPHSEKFMEAYEDVMREPYSYLVIDVHVAGDDKVRLRTNVFPGEDMIIYDAY